MSDENETVEPTYDVQYTSVRQLRVFVGFDNGSSRWPLRHELVPACRALLEKMTPEERSSVRIDESAEIGKLRKRIDELSDTVATREGQIEMLLEAAETVHEAIDRVRRLKKQATGGMAMANEWRDILMSIRDELAAASLRPVLRDPPFVAAAQTVVDAAIRFRKVCRGIVTDAEADLCASVDNFTYPHSGDPE